VTGGRFWKAFQSGYDALPDNQLKQRVRWDVYLLVLRALAMFMMAAHGLAFILVPLMALVLSYFEIWPERARCGLWRSVAAVRVRSGRSCVEPAPTLTPATTFAQLKNLYCQYQCHPRNPWSSRFPSFGCGASYASDGFD
jgi:hypothetical protein